MSLQGEKTRAVLLPGAHVPNKSGFFSFVGRKCRQASNGGSSLIALGLQMLRAQRLLLCLCLFPAGCPEYSHCRGREPPPPHTHTPEGERGSLDSIIEIPAAGDPTNATAITMNVQQDGDLMAAIASIDEIKKNLTEALHVSFWVSCRRG